MFLIGRLSIGARGCNHSHSGINLHITCLHRLIKMSCMARKFREASSNIKISSTLYLCVSKPTMVSN